MNKYQIKSYAWEMVCKENGITTTEYNGPWVKYKDVKELEEKDAKISELERMLDLKHSVILSYEERLRKLGKLYS